jgi:LacI family transcriptional regulator
MARDAAIPQGARMAARGSRQGHTRQSTATSDRQRTVASRLRLGWPRRRRPLHLMALVDLRWPRTRKLLDSLTEGRADLPEVTVNCLDVGQDRLDDIPVPAAADAVIYSSSIPGVQRWIEALGRPAIDISNLQTATDSSCRFIVDDLAVGAAAARHLLQRRQRSLIYVATGFHFCSLRERGFRDEARRAGVTVQTVTKAWDVVPMKRRLPGPWGILSGTWNHSRDIVTTIEHLGLQVPHDVSLVVAGDDHASLSHAEHPITIVPLAAQRIGWAIRERLHQVIDGTLAPGSIVTVAPDEPVVRLSSDPFASDDPLIRQVVDMLRQDLYQQHGLEATLATLPQGRRSIEQACVAVFGGGPQQVLQALRLDAACRLSLCTQRPWNDIASACGFGSDDHLRQVMRRVMGCSPSEWRSDVDRRWDAIACV